MKLQNFLKDDGSGNEREKQMEAAQALFTALREERGIYLSIECLPWLFAIGNSPKQRIGFQKTPKLLVHHAISNGLEQVEQVIDHLKIGGTEIELTNYLLKDPIPGSFIDYSQSIPAFKQLLDPHMPLQDPYLFARAYFKHLSNNGIRVARNKLDELLSRDILEQFTNQNRTLNLMIDEELTIKRCVRGWTKNSHGNNWNVHMGYGWVEDSDGYIKQRLEQELNYSQISDGVCSTCQLGLNELIALKNKSKK